MMKFIIISLFAVAMSVTSMLVSAQTPVTVTSDLPSLMHQAETMVQWGKQYKQMLDQLVQQEQQYAALIGNRNLGQILNGPELRNYLPEEWASVYDKVKGNNLPEISSAASAISSQEKFDQTATGGQKRYQDTLAANKAMAIQAFSSTRKRLDNINALMQQSNLTQDPKAAADLLNRISTENAMIQNEQNRLNLMLQLQQIELKLAEEQRSREFKDIFFR